MTGFETYCLYLALKSHLTQKNYDYVKYHGKVSATQESFLKRRDRYHFEKLAKTYTEDVMVDFLVANLILGKTWAGDLLEKSAKVNLERFQKHKESRTYNVTNEIGAVMELVSSPKDLFRVVDCQYPLIIISCLNKSISIETLVILNQYVDFVTVYDQKFGHDDPVWGKLSILISKLLPFVSYDKTKIRDVMSILLVS